jgi:hypothetical protein
MTDHPAAAEGCEFEHPHPEHPCGERVHTFTAAGWGEFLRDCRPVVDITDDDVAAAIRILREIPDTEEHSGVFSALGDEICHPYEEG